MKKSILRLPSFLLLFSILSFGQTQKEIIEIQKTINKDYFNHLVKGLEKSYNFQEIKVENYLLRTGESRITLLKDGSSLYMIDISDKGTPIYYAVDNYVEAVATLTNTMYGILGLNTEGAGMSIGVWDENRALGTHQEFTTSSSDNTSRMSYGDSAISGTSTDHATHVSGTIGARGVQTNARGMAFRSSIVSYNWSNDKNEVTQAANNGMLITNHSYGTPMFNNNTGNFQLEEWAPGCYTTDSAAWDAIAYATPMTLSVVSAGNEGNTSPPAPMSPGLDKLVGNKVSKNNLVVANGYAVTRGSDGKLTNVSINSSSSVGPSDDLRVKPDITGVGTGVYSPIGTSNTDYDTYTGTSMAAPNVAGSILLLQEYYNTLYGGFMRAATLKGIVCLTSDDGGTEGPDPFFGWGLLNMRAASTAIRNKGTMSIIEENTLLAGETYTTTITLNSAGTLLAGISWTDYPGSIKSQPLNNPSSVLYNDLDIRITKGGQTFLPWMLNPANPKVAIKGDNTKDNLEIVRIDNAEPGVYTITVSAKGLIGTPQGQPFGQKYSLIITGDDATASIDENILSADFRIFPNPTQGVLNFETADSMSLDKVEIYDAIGKRVFSSAVYNNSIDISALTSGVYFVKAFSGERQITKKIVKN